VVRFKFQDLIACLMVGELRDSFEPSPQSIFSIRVDGWLPFFGREKVLHRPPEKRRQLAISPRRFAEPVPYGVPFSAAVEQQLPCSFRSTVLRIEVKVPHAYGAKRLPSPGIAARAELFRLAHPQQNIANRITDRQPVKILRFQPTPAQAGNWLCCQKGQGPGKRISGRRIQSEVQTQALFRAEESFNGPVATAALLPNRSPILQLNQRLKHFRAIASRSQLLPINVGQVENWHDAFRRTNAGQGPVHDAFEPRHRSRSSGGVIRAERIELRERRR
jgi:hypothetical protein